MTLRDESPETPDDADILVARNDVQRSHHGMSCQDEEKKKGL